VVVPTATGALTQATDSSDLSSHKPNSMSPTPHHHQRFEGMAASRISLTLPHWDARMESQYPQALRGL
jgi:hypothetical protein